MVIHDRDLFILNNKRLNALINVHTARLLNHYRYSNNLYPLKESPPLIEICMWWSTER